MDDKNYDSRYDGETTDKIYWNNAKAIMEQTTAEDGETVQVYDTDGVPHKVSKTELLKKVYTGSSKGWKTSPVLSLLMKPGMPSD